jgi:F-type H+-transporting ATPase subunit delta
MPASAAARRYAQAVFDIAAERQAFDTWDADLRVIRETLEADPALLRIFENPETEPAEKERLIERLFARNVSPEAYNFLRVLLKHQRIVLAPQVQEAYEEMYLAAQGVAFADVTTAVPLTPVEEAQVAEALTRITGKTIKLRTHVDTNIIGGILARVGDQLIDGTVTTQLRQLKSRLAAV